MSSFQTFNTLTHAVTVDRALSIAVPRNLVRSQYLELQAATQKFQSDRRRKVGQLQSQIETEAEAEARARAQVHAQAQDQPQPQGEVKGESEAKDQEEQRQQSQHPSRGQNPQYRRSRLAREEAQQHGRRRGQRQARDAVYSPVACATVPLRSAVPLSHYFRHVPLTPSLPPNSSSLSSSRRALTPPPGPANPFVEVDTETETTEDAERLQNKYKSESVAHASALALASGSRGVQPHSSVSSRKGGDRVSTNSSATTSATTVTIASYSTAATIASVAASHESNRRYRSGGKGVYTSAPLSSSWKLNAAATPFVATQNVRNHAGDDQEATNDSGYIRTGCPPLISSLEEWNGQVGCYSYMSAREIFQASAPFHNAYTINSNADIINPTSVRPNANPFPSTSALSSFTPSLPPQSPSLPPPESLISSPSPPTSSLITPSSKEDLATFLAEEERLLSFQLSLTLRLQYEELKLAQQLAKNIN